MAMDKRHFSKSLGFTLIELLVVVSIIALLVSILLPALSKAREQAKKAVCGTQLSQLGKGVYEYAVENDMALPLYDRKEADRRGYTNQGLYYVNVTKLWGNEKSTGELIPRLLDPYLGKQVQECPLDKGYQPEAELFFTNWSEIAGRSFYDIYGTSYIYNTGMQYATGGSTVSSLGDNWGVSIVETLYNKKISSIREPSLFCMAGDRTWTYAEYYTGGQLYARKYKLYQKMHSSETQELNMVFVDGHVNKTEMYDPPDHLRNNEYCLVPAKYDY